MLRCSVCRAFPRRGPASPRSRQLVERPLRAGLHHLDLSVRRVEAWPPAARRANRAEPSRQIAQDSGRYRLPSWLIWWTLIGQHRQRRSHATSFGLRLCCDHLAGRFRVGPEKSGIASCRRAGAASPRRAGQPGFGKGRVSQPGRDALVRRGGQRPGVDRSILAHRPAGPRRIPNRRRHDRPRRWHRNQDRQSK